MVVGCIDVFHFVDNVDDIIDKNFYVQGFTYENIDALCITSGYAANL